MYVKDPKVEPEIRGRYVSKATTSSAIFFVVGKTQLAES